jgi:uncharacterized protein
MSDLNQAHNRAVWFDIPVADLDRACAFYAATLAIGVEQSEFDGFRMGVLEHEEGNGGCLFIKPEDISTTGLLVYMNAEGRIRDAVAKAVEAGGKVVEDTHAIGPHGFRAILLDSEGNRIALHSSVDA